MQSCVLFAYGSVQEPYFFIVLHGLKIMQKINGQSKTKVQFVKRLGCQSNADVEINDQKSIFVHSKKATKLSTIPYTTNFSNQYINSVFILYFMYPYIQSIFIKIISYIIINKRKIKHKKTSNIKENVLYRICKGTFQNQCNYENFSRSFKLLKNKKHRE